MFPNSVQAQPEHPAQLPWDDTIIMGDFNAHNSAWLSQTGESQANSRENTILDLLNTSNFALLNEDSNTMVPTGALSHPLTSQ